MKITSIDEIRNLAGTTLFYEYNPENQYELVRDIEFKYIHKDKVDNIYFSFPYSDYGDYSGSTVEKSNYKEMKKLIKEKYKEQINDKILFYSGGYDYHAILIQVPFFLQDEELQDIACHLEDYPLIDEMAHSELESDEVQEYLQNNIRDYMNMMENVLCLDDDEQYDSDIVEVISYIIDWPQFIQDIMEEIKIYPEFETGCNVYIDNDKIRNYIEMNEDTYAKMFNPQNDSPVMSTRYTVKLLHELRKKEVWNEAETAFINDCINEVLFNHKDCVMPCIESKLEKQIYNNILDFVVIPAYNYHNIHNTGIQEALKLA